MDTKDTPVIPPSKEDSLEKIIARVDFYESSVEQLKRDVPKYFSSLSANDKQHASLGKVLRAVASNEPHSLLQYVLFAYAQREEDLATEHLQLKAFSEESKAILEDWNKKLISPMRMLIQDHSTVLQNKSKNSTKDMTDPSKSADLSKRAASSTVTPSTADASEFLRSPLSVHAKLFEKHRILELTKFLKHMLTSQIAFHAKSIESYSQLLECLNEIDEIDTSTKPKSLSNNHMH